MAKDKTEKYVVIKKHCLGHEIGAVIELSPEKAKGLVGKVRLASEEIDENNISVTVGKLQTENNELNAEVDSLKNEVKNLKAKLKAKDK